MGAIRTGLTDYSPRIRLFGAALWVAWITVVYSSEPLVPGVSNVYEGMSIAFSVSTFSLAVCLIGASFFPGKARDFMSNAAMAGTLSCIGGIATLIELFVGVTPLPLTCAAAMTTGFVTSCIALRVAILFSEIDAKNMLIGMCCTVTLGVLVYSFSTMLASYGMPLVSAGILVLLLPASAFFLWLPCSEQRRSGVDESDELPAFEDARSPRLFGRLLAYIALLMFVLSVSRGYYPNLITPEQFAMSRGAVALGLVVASLGIAALVAAMPRGASFGTLCYALMFASVVSVPLLTLAGVDPTWVGNISSVLFGATMMCIWGLLCRLSFCSGLSPIKSVGLGFGCACLGTTAGFAAGAFLFAASEGNDAAHMTMLVFSLAVCVCAAMLLLRKRDMSILMQPSWEDVSEFEGYDEKFAASQERSVDELAEAQQDCTPGADDDSPLESLADLRTFMERTCGFLAQEHGLSPREEDVLVQLALGKDAKTIADELFISFNTVRTHIRRIYAKLEVHNRRDLMDALYRKADCGKES